MTSNSRTQSTPVQRWDFAGRNIVGAPDDPWVVLRDGMYVWEGIRGFPCLTEAQQQGVNARSVASHCHLLKIVHSLYLQ
jgi:hypothetical protein